MTKRMKKTCLAVVLVFLALPMVLQEVSAYIVPPIIMIENHSRDPIVPTQDQDVEVTCYVYRSGGSSLSVRLYYRITGSSQFTQVTMSSNGDSYVKWDDFWFHGFSGIIPGADLYDVVEYYVEARGVAGGEETVTKTPTSGYYSYTVNEPAEISWSSPSAETEFTFGPVDDNIVFNFTWSYVNLDDADLEIGSQTFDILTGGTKITQVILDGAPLDGASISATLKGYNGGALAASDARTFHFRRLDYNLQWETPSNGSIISFSPTGPAKFNLTFSQGVDIDHVNLTFNDIDMGEVSSPEMVEFTFESFEGIINATLKGYDSGDSLLATDTHIFVFRRLIVEVIWETPSENSRVTFGVGTDPVKFNITFSKGTDVNYVKLELNGHDMGNVTSPAMVEFGYNDSFHGHVEAILTGFNEFGSEISNNIHNFTFDKITTTRFEILENKTFDLGNKLYLILHDPNGDDSTSSYEESTSLSLGVGCEITAGVTVGLEIGIEEEISFFGLFSTGIEASNKLSLSLEASLGFDARFEITDSTFLSSSDSSDVDYIGPGYGDRYWGELWKFKYVITIHYVEYYNTTQVYYNPHFWWGILRDVEAYLSDANAPASWKALNPVHQNFPGDQVEWIGGTLVTDGGGTYINNHEVTNTNTMSEAITIGLEDETKAKLSAGGAYVEGSLVLSLNTKVYAEQSVSNTIKTEYTIRDDDSSDSIVQRVGIDKNFGTYIFKTETDFCSTSNPIEHNTKDYIPPKIEYPTIIYDTDQDFKGPTPQDSPLVTVRIEEEGGIQDAVLYYSIDNGTSWRSTQLLEYPGQPDVWHANIPKQVNETKVLWYLRAWDITGNAEVKYNIDGTYFSYEVGILINPLMSATPGFTAWSVLFGIGVGVFWLKFRKNR